MKDLLAKPLTQQIYLQLRDLIAGMNIKPVLAVLMAGNDPAASFYVRNIGKMAEKIGAELILKQYPSDISQEELTSEIHSLNNNASVHGIMLQKPLPKAIDDNVLSSTINSWKDVDGLSPVNLGKLMMEEDGLYPCTPQAVMEIISFYGIDLKNRHTVLCGRSNIVGKPLINLLLRKKEPGNATVTACHSKTEDIARYTREADILITAVGRAGFIKSDMLKENAIVIDVGTNEIVKDGKTTYVGDVDYENSYEKVSAITPVPGGVGSVTTAMLLTNLCKAARQQLRI